MFGFGAGELLLILFIALIFIGPKKLPELAKGLGKAIRDFNKAKDGLLETDFKEKDDDEEHVKKTHKVEEVQEHPTASPNQNHVLHNQKIEKNAESGAGNKSTPVRSNEL